jgi:hypothetical protein
LSRGLTRGTRGYVPDYAWQSKGFRLHKVIALDHPDATEGKVYLEAQGVRVLHVFTDLPKSITTMSLRTDLLKRPGRDAEYDDVIVHTEDEPDPSRS